MRDSLAEKIRKLLNLQKSAEKIGSIEEANAAAAKIQELVTKHNIDLAQVDMSDPDAKKEELPLNHRKINWFATSIGGDWKLQILRALARYNFCSVLNSGQAKFNAYIIGNDENIESVLYMYELVCEAFVRIGKMEFKKYQFDPYGYNKDLKAVGLDTFLRKFLKGCEIGLAIKLKEQAIKAKELDEAKVKEAAGTGLMRISLEMIVTNNRIALNDYTKRQWRVTQGRPTSKRAENDTILHNGIQTGKNSSLTKASIGSSSSAKVNSPTLRLGS